MIGYIVVTKYLRYDPDSGRWNATFRGAWPYEQLAHAQIARDEIVAEGDPDRDTRLQSCELTCIELEPGAPFINRRLALSRVPSTDTRPKEVHS